MSAVGYASIPVTLSFANAAKAVQSQLKPQLDKLSKDAAASIDKNVGSAAEQAAAKVKRARENEEKATKAVIRAKQDEERQAEKVVKAKNAEERAEQALARAREDASGKAAAAEEKLNKVRSDSQATTEQIAAAEREYQRALQDIDADIAKKTDALADARGRVLVETRKLEDAETNASRAQQKAEEASERVTAALKQQDEHQRLATRSGRDLAGMLDSMRDAAGRAAGKVGEFAQKHQVQAGIIAGGIGALGKNMADYASEAEQSYGAVESIFAGHADQIVAKSQEAAHQVGLSGREYRELASTTGAMLKNMGMPMDEVSGKTQDLVALGADLAATFGGPTKDAVDAIGSLLRGEADPIERYGVSIKKADVNARLAAKGLSGLEGEALKQAEAQELLAMLTEQTADAQGQFARETDTAAHKQQVATAAIDDAREKIGTALLPVMADLMDVGARIAEVIGEHPRLFLAIAGAVGTLAAGVVALGTIAPIFTAVSAAAAAAGTSMWGYVAAQTAAIAPIAAVVAGVGVLAAGLTYFFTQTETGRQVWTSFTEAVSAGWQRLQGVLVVGFDVVRGAFAAVGSALVLAWDGVVAGFQAGWSVVSSVFNAFVTAGQWLVTIISTVVLTPLVLAWEALSWAFKQAYDSIIMPTVNAFAGAMTWLYDNAVRPVMDSIVGKWNELSSAFETGWAVVNAVFDYFAGKAQEVWGEYLSPVFQAISDGWNVMVWAVQLGWGVIRDEVFRPFAERITGLWESYVSPVLGYISDKWSWLKDSMLVVKGIIVDLVFGKIEEGLSRLKSSFQVAVDGIRFIWDQVKAITAKPARFVVETVYNNGIRKAWGLVSKFTGLDPLPEADLGYLGSYATGGVLPGYTPGRDVYQMVDPKTGLRVDLGGGEAIMRPEFTAVVGRDSIDALNRAARQGGKAGVAKVLGEGAQFAYARGGVFPNGDTEIKENQSRRIERAIAFMQREDGKPYQWGGVGDPSWDCSGLWSGIVHELNGRDGRSGRQFNTTSLMANPSAWGFVPGLSGPITVGVSSDHMAGTLAGTNAESRGGDGVLWGRGAWGSTNGYFPNKYTLASFLGEFMPGAEGGGGRAFNPMSIAKGLWDGVIDKIGAFPGADTMGLIGQMPAAFLKKAASSVWDFVKEKIGSVASVFSGDSGSSGNAESWREMAMWAMRREGFNADDPRQVNAMLAQIMSESGGNAGIAQQIVDVNGTGDSAGVGLLQIIPGTFAAHRDPSLPNDRRDPEANMVAALRYYKSRYGMDLTTTWGHGHGYATGGVLPGYTPGRDVHQFFSPTAGWLGLSGGESIMVPEWTRSVGGPAAVEQMNRAARGGRTAAGAGAGFAAGGVFAANAGDPVTRLAGAADMLAVAVAEIREAYHGGDMGYGALASVLRNEPWARAIVNGAASLGRISDPDTLEGIAARAFASESVDILGSLGAKNTAAVAGSLITAESNLVKARKDSASRVAAIAAAEETLAEKRRELAALQGEKVELSVKDQRKLADAEEALAKARAESEAVTLKEGKDSKKAQEQFDKAKEASNEKVAKAEEKLRRVQEDLGIKAVEDEEKRAEAIEKSKSDIVKAEDELLKARRASAAALDMKIYDVFPQLYDGLSESAAQAQQRLPQVAGALSNLAFLAGPAGASVGMAVQAAKNVIDVVQTVWGVVVKITDWINNIRIQTRTAVWELTKSWSELTGVVDQHRGMVAQLQMQLVNAAVDVIGKSMEMRTAQVDVVRAQLQGAKNVAEAEAALQAERDKVTGKQKWNFRDMSLEYDRFRQGYRDGINEQIAGMAQLSVQERDRIMATIGGVGRLSDEERARLVDAVAGMSDLTVEERERIVAAINGNGELTAADRARLSAAIAGMTDLSAADRERMQSALTGIGSVTARERDRILSAMDGLVTLTAEERARLSASVAGMSELSERERARVMVSLNGVGQLTEEERDRVRQAVGSFDDLTAGERERINSALAGVGTLTVEERARVANAIAGMSGLSEEERERIIRAINGVSEVAQEERLRVVAALTGIGSIHGKEDDLTRQIVANADKEGLAVKLGLDAKLAAQKAADDAYIASVNGREVGERELHQMYKLQLAEQLVGEQAFQNLKDASLDAQLEWQRRVDKAAQLGLEHELKARAAVTPEILALQREVYAAEFAQQKSILDAQIKGIEATFAQQQALVSMGRLQEDLLRQQAELDRLSGQTMGMNQGQAIVMEEIARLEAQNAEIMGKRNSAGAGARNFFGRMFDWNGDGNGGRNTWSVERKQYDAQIAANNAQIEELKRSQYASGAFTPAQQREIDKATKLAAKYFAQGNEAAAKAALQASPLGNAQRSLEVNKTLSRITDWEKQQRDLRREQQDMLAEFKKNTRIMPLQWRSQELESRESAQRYAADALRSDNAGVRDALATLSRLEESNAAELKQLREKPTVVNVTVPGPRDGVTTIGEMEDALVALAGELGVTRTDVKRLNEARRTSASDRVRAAIGR